MSNLRRILCSGPWLRALAASAVLVATVGCGQRGPLYLPTEPAAANRATLPQVLNPAGTSTSPTPAPPRQTPNGTGTGTAAPVTTP
jgi:predicted small lipoprotein YifL